MRWSLGTPEALQALFSDASRGEWGRSFGGDAGAFIEASAGAGGGMTESQAATRVFPPAKHPKPQCAVLRRERPPVLPALTAFLRHRRCYVFRLRQSARRC
ncbi:hypothetical protein VTN00DRAFT_489 [Thermoascus crustaceus]|uniref:uncharacterized protein n=1 Tax=Thermoascus crustaceus TaxID=5088 RepID=UPI003743981D